MARILIIDDEEDIRDILRDRLNDADYEVISARDGIEGIAKAVSEKPDLIILDVVMPTMNGYEFIKEFKRLDQIRQIPVLVLTVQDKLADIFKMEGVSDYVLKPYEADVLLEKIQACLASSEK